MNDHLSPTPYADVNAVLQEFVLQIKSILAEQFVGLYLYGSLAVGGFDPHTSDIDFIVLTNNELTDPQFNALASMHASFEQNNPVWGKKIEAAYIPLGALTQTPSTSSLHPQIEKETVLVRAPLEMGWVFQRYSLREFGIAAAGPSPRGLVEQVDRREMNQAAASMINAWKEQSRHDPSWLEWVKIMNSLSFVVLTLCRIRYSLQTGSVTSKPAAARWAQAAIGPRWTALIERALAGIHNYQACSENDLSEMLDFLNDSALCCGQPGLEEAG